MGHSAAWDRIGAVSGILFAVLVILGIQVAAGPADAAVPGDIAGIIALDFGQRHNELWFSAFLITAGMFFLFWFLAFLRDRLEEAQGGGDGCRRWPTAVA